MNQKLYKKLGRRYVPIRECIDDTGWTEGFYLVHVQPGSVSTRHCLIPDYPCVAAALKVCADVMVKKMTEAAQARPSRTPLTKAQRDAWEALNKAMGGMVHLQHPAPADVVEAGMGAVADAIRATRKP